MLTRLSLELPEFALKPETSPGAGVILSPDGRRIVYTGRGADGPFRLYTRTLDQEEAAPMAGTEGAYGPFFSPDGQAVGFFAGSKLKKTSVERGGVVVLCDTASEGLGGSWGEDGNIIAALNSIYSILSRIPSGGGTVQPVTELKAERKEYAHLWPQVLPGAQAVLFTALPITDLFEEATIELQSLRTGERKTLMRGGYYGRYVPSGHLLYVHQGTLYAASMDVKRLELTGPVAPVVEEVVSNTTWGFAQAYFSWSGTLVYVRGKAARQTLVWLDSSGQTQPLRAEGAEYTGSVRFSPDGATNWTWFGDTAIVGLSRGAFGSTESRVPEKLSDLSFPNPRDAVNTRVLDFSYQRASHSWRCYGRGHTRIYKIAATLRL
jgi:hypothetical protein